jgi:general transcription factor 3C polypeptide 3 (transcription factor C subunit 4)
MVKWQKQIDAMRQLNERGEASRLQREGSSRPRGRGSRLGGATRGVHRGPRRAAEPTGDVKWRLGRASQLFIQQNYDEAIALTDEIIQINAETHEAWTLKASIYKEQGNLDKAVSALMFAAHLRPRHISAWFYCANFCLEETGDQRHNYLRSALFCYSAVARTGAKSLEAYLGKADIFYELEKWKVAFIHYKKALQLSPNNMDLLRRLAEVSLEIDNTEGVKVSVHEVIALYKETIHYLRTSEVELEFNFGWMEAIIYLELYAFAGMFEEAIRELKSVARWLLGREEDVFWDGVTSNDSEWDAYDDRRKEVAEFEGEKFPPEQYGMGLPLELRVKLGLWRMRLGHHQESQVIFSLI